jgi:hypothetical protein
MGQLLGSRLALHDVEDVERFCAAIVQRSRFNLGHYEHEDLTSYLIEECWQLSLRFEPGGIRFSTYAGNTLGKRCHDWFRTHNGRTKWAFKDRVYERPPRPQFISLDHPECDRLGSSLGSSSLDDDEHRLADELRRLRARARRPGGRDDWLGDEAA